MVGVMQVNNNQNKFDILSRLCRILTMSIVSVPINSFEKSPVECLAVLIKSLLHVEAGEISFTMAVQFHEERQSLKGFVNMGSIDGAQGEPVLVRAILQDECRPRKSSVIMNTISAGSNPVTANQYKIRGAGAIIDMVARRDTNRFPFLLQGRESN